MKLRTLLATTALFLSAPALAQQTLPNPVEDERVPAAEMEMEAPAKVPAMWVVKDEDTTIYMFGTVHMLPGNVEWKTPLVKTALESADSLVTELDMTPENTAALSQKINAAGALPQGTTLRSLMSEEQKTTFETGLAKVGIPAEAFDGLEPWLAAIALVQTLAQAAGATPENGVEAVLERTVPEGTKRVALESPEFQIDVFDKLAVEQQLIFLLGGAEDPIAGIEALNTIVTLWSEGKSDELGEMMRDGFSEIPELGDRLIYNRNANWAEWIDKRLDEPGTVFMAVGALHLAGEGSVQDYLAERDIETTRVQ